MLGRDRTSPKSQDEMELTIQRSIVTELNESALGLLGACEPGILGFSPLNVSAHKRFDNRKLMDFSISVS